MNIHIRITVCGYHTGVKKFNIDYFDYEYFDLSPLLICYKICKSSL
nr:MAG TPA: hypothetical protein [Caudoviricetes sp.]